MPPKSLLTANGTLIRNELARASARPLPRRRRVTMPAWLHEACDDQATTVLTHATHVERLCGRCGYRAFHTHDGQLLGHHGGNGLILLRRPDHAGDIVLTAFADGEVYQHVYWALKTSAESSYSMFVASEPEHAPHGFKLTAVHGQLSDLDGTPLRSYLLMYRQELEQKWAGWRQMVSEQLVLKLPPQLGTFSWSEHEASTAAES